MNITNTSKTSTQNPQNYLQYLNNKYAETLKNLQTAPSVKANTALARIIWHLIAEPADPLAGKLIAAYGAYEALEIVIKAHTSRRKLATVFKPENTENEFSNQAITAAWERWQPRIAETNLDKQLSEIINIANQKQIKLILPEHQNWPQQLNHLEHHAPLLLWYQGDPNLLNHKNIAIVGSRAASNYGKLVTAHFVQQLKLANYVITSGAAIGIDTAAHTAAINNNAKTIAVLAGGLNNPYPRCNNKLLEQIKQQHGVVVSEMPPNGAATRWRFLQRNRIIAALAEATLVTEASSKSGSINTAGHTAQLGRKLGAVPGNIDSYGSQGCHKLLKEYGAELIAGTKDLYEMLEITEIDTLDAENEREKSIHIRILDALPLKGHCVLAQIATKSGVSVAECRDALAELELLGKVSVDSSGFEKAWRLQR